MSVGLLGDPNGFDFHGTVEVGPHSVALLSADAAHFGSAHLAGGTLVSLNALEVEIDAFDPLDPRQTSALFGHGTIHGTLNIKLSRPGEAPAVIAGTTGPIELTGITTIYGNGTLINVIRSCLVRYKPGFSAAFNAEVPPSGIDWTGETHFQLLGPESGQVVGIPGPPNPGTLVAGDYTQLYMAGGPTPIVGPLIIHTSDPDDPSNSYEPKAGDVFHLIVTGPLDAGRFGGLKDPATFSYPDPDNLLILDNAELSPGLEWDVQMRSDGLSLVVVSEPSTLALLSMGTVALLAYASRRRWGR